MPWAVRGASRSRKPDLKSPQVTAVATKHSVNGIKQLPCFNGWRAVAILLVLGLHTEYTPGMPPQLSDFAFKAFDGLLGVRCFFTISGFLITWLMLQEENAAGFMSLKNFYVRRALRILPVYLACLMVMAFLQLAGVATQTGFIWLQLLTFTRNFYQTGHFECPISLHFWSLSVEEQFYLVWPLVFVSLACSTRSRIWFLAGMITFSVGSKIIALLGCYSRNLYFLFQDYATFHYLDCLAYGCLGAILLDTQAASLKKFSERFLWPVFLLACLFLLVPEFVRLGIGLQSLGFGLLLLQSVLVPEFKPFRILNHRWVVAIGILSYSLYIWQQLVFLLWPFPRLWFLALPSTFVAAWLSYNFLEKPFFSLRSKFRAQGSAQKFRG